MPDAGPNQRPATQTTAELSDLLQAFEADGEAIIAAGWFGGLRDFWIDLSHGRRLMFLDCLQVGLHRSLDFEQSLAIGSWWVDEPSPLLQSLPPEVRLLFHHIVFEVGDGLLRVACRRVETSPGTSSRSKPPAAS